MIRRIVYGDPEEVMRLLGVDSGGKINTVYIGRINLTVRNFLAIFVRKEHELQQDHAKAYSHSGLLPGMVQFRQAPQVSQARGQSR